MKHSSFFLSTIVLSIGLVTACTHEQEPVYEEDLMNDPVAIRFGEGMPRIAATKGLGPIDNWNPTQDLYIYGIAREGVNSQATAAAPLDLTATGILINNVKAESAPAPNANPAEIRESIAVYSDTDLQLPFFYAPDRRYEFFGYYVDDAVENPSPTVGEESITLPIVIDGSQDIMVASTDKDADKALATQDVSIDRLYSATSARRGVVPNLVFQHQLSRFNVQVRNGSSSQAASNFKLSYIRIQSATEGTLVIATKQDKKPGGIIDPANPQYLDLVRDGHVLSPADNLAPSDDWTEVGDVLAMPGDEIYKMKIGLLQMGYTAEGIPAEVDYDIDLNKLIVDADAEPYAEPGRQYNVKIIIYGLEEINVSVTLVPWEEVGDLYYDPDGEGPYVPVTSVTVSPTELTLDKGETADLTATVYPPDATYPTVSWTSSNTAVATVSNGQVTAVGEGQAIITAKAGGKSGSCEVTVNNTGGLASPLSFTSTGSTSITLTKVGSADAITLEYKKGDGAWTSYTIGQSIALGDGQKVSFRAGEGGNSSLGNSGGNYNFSVSGSGTVAASGDVMSLLNKEGGLTIPAEYCFRALFSGCDKLTSAPELPATTLAKSCYAAMFAYCTSLTTAPELPATTMVDGSYYSMFLQCASLTSAPELPATTLAVECYDEMFYGCTSLTSAPVLPATTLAEACYIGMFLGCTGLTTAPELPATTLAVGCYSEMFYGCTSLTTAPELPATTLLESCYEGMFWGCTSLTTAPELPAINLAYYCYQRMFNGCSQLNYIKALFTTTPSSYYTDHWVEGVAATGTFVKSSAATWDIVGINGVPEGWTIETE